MAISSGYSAEDLARLGPDALTRRRMLAEALLAKSAGQRKIEHPLQGAAQMAEALINGLRVRKLDQAETAGMKSGESAWEGLFGGSNASAPSAAMPATTGAGQELAATSPSGSKPLDMSGNEVFGQFIDTVKQGGVQNPYALSAIAATGKAESGFDPKNATRTWSDPSESGQPGTAGGIMSWRGPRYQALAATGDLSPAGQAKFFLQENPQLIQALNNAKSVEEAQGLMNNAWKFAGYDRPGGEASRRLQLASSFLPTFQNREVASASPQAAIEAAAPGSGYVDPMVSAPNYIPATASAPVSAAPAAASFDDRFNAPTAPLAYAPPEIFSQTSDVPKLPAPREIGPAPAVAAVPPQQLAQALTGNSAPPQQQGPSVQDLAKIISNPWVSDEKKKIAQILLGKQLEQNDPLKKMQLEKGQLEIDQLRNPRLSPADQARLDMERQKLEFDRNKPTEVNGRLVGPDGKIVYEGGLSAEQDARLRLDREKFEAEKAKGQWQKLTDGRLYNETTGEFKDAPPPAPGSVPPKFDDISSVRKEIQQLPAYKNMAQAAPIYKSMVETAGRNTRASDLNLVYGLGKIMDPTSVVREGEMVMVKNTASLPDWLVGAANALNGGAALQPETRKAIMTEAFGRMKGYSDEFEKNTGQYKGIAQRFNMNPDDVIPPFEQFQPWDGVADTPSPASPSSPADGMKKTTTGIPWRPIQ